jgi:hypothetical protein
MSYISKITDTQEKLLMLVRPHWIYPVEGMIWWIGLTVTGIVGDYFLYAFFHAQGIHFAIDLGFLHLDEASYFLPWIFGSVGLGIFWSQALIYVSDEIGLTSKRIIYKKGLLFIEVDQVDLDDVRAEQVMHGWLGWMFRYGKIHLDCRFIGDVWIPAIGRPYKLIKGIHIARMQHPDIHYERQDLERDLDHIREKETRHFPMRHAGGTNNINQDKSPIDLR